MMIENAHSVKKCLTCQRWSGWREPDALHDSITYDASRQLGECVEGPWHGSLRSVRNACGRWVVWEKLVNSASPDC